MNQKLQPRTSLKVQLMSGILGLTTLCAFNTGNPVQAASLSCGPGNNWVQTCSSGSRNFLNSVTISVNFGFSPNNQPDFTANLAGTTNILLGDPVDAIVDDPLLGNVGTVDGNLDVIKTEFVSSTSSGTTPFVPLIVAVAGDNVPDLEPTPPDADLPFESLHSAGAIAETSDNAALADSFLNLFLEIQGTPEGTIRPRAPLTLTASSPLIGFPPGADLNLVDYVSTEITQLFDAGEDGLFWTGDEIEVARLVPDASGRAVVLNLDPIAVTEPSTLIASVLMILGIVCQHKRRKST